MTYKSSIHQWLSIEDKNITFNEKYILPTVKIKDKTYRQLSATISYTPRCCEKCGIKNENKTIIKHGFKPTCLLMGDVNFSPLLLQLKKQRFLCKACGSTFIARTTIVDNHCHISHHVKRKIIDLLTQKTAMSTIAKQTFVSTHTIIKVLRKTAKSMFSHRQLPQQLCIDNFNQ